MMRRIRSLAICVVALFCVVESSLTALAWGDNTEDGRPTYSLQEINEGILGDKITFNSISIKDTDYDWYLENKGEEIPAYTITEEVNYVGARVVGQDFDYWQGNEIEVQNGETYVIRLYAHNNNPGGYDAVAEDTKVSFEIPQETGTNVRVNGYISSSNASPTGYVDYVDFKSDQAFHLEYVYGSALLENNGIGANGGVQLSDDIVNSVSGGVLIGYDALDGKVPGCYQYANYVTIQVKAVYDTEFTLEKQVRLKDSEDKTWQDSVNAQIGDEVEFKITYTNTSKSDAEQRPVLRDVLPANLEYVPGTTMVYNATYPNGASLDDGQLTSDGGVILGYYSGQSNLIVVFTAKVVDENLAWGSNTLVNWGRATVEQTIRQDHAEVVVQNDQPIRIASIITIVLAILLAINSVITWILLIRMRAKRKRK